MEERHLAELYMILVGWSKDQGDRGLFTSYIFIPAVGSYCWFNCLWANICMDFVCLHKQKAM